MTILVRWYERFIEEYGGGKRPTIPISKGIGGIIERDTFGVIQRCLMGYRSSAMPFFASSGRSRPVGGTCAKLLGTHILVCPPRSSSPCGVWIRSWGWRVGIWVRRRIASLLRLKAVVWMYLRPLGIILSAWRVALVRWWRIVWLVGGIGTFLGWISGGSGLLWIELWMLVILTIASLFGFTSTLSKRSAGATQHLRAMLTTYVFLPSLVGVPPCEPSSSRALT